MTPADDDAPSVADRPAAEPSDGEPRAVEEQVSGLAALDDPVRRALYLHVANATDEVGRDEAARVAGISRSLAGFHLDRLVAEGLLEATFRRLSGRSGPGAGRPAKLYRRSRRQIDVTLPPRRYELAAKLLASALDGGGGRPAQQALATASQRRGVALGETAARQAGEGAEPSRRLDALIAALAAQGYQPEVVDGELRLRNCPFHALVGDHTQLVCGMNLALLQGVVAGLGFAGRAELLPRPGLCCVRIALPAAGASQG